MLTQAGENVPKMRKCEMREKDVTTTFSFRCLCTCLLWCVRFCLSSQSRYCSFDWSIIPLVLGTYQQPRKDMGRFLCWWKSECTKRRMMMTFCWNDASMMMMMVATKDERVGFLFFILMSHECAVGVWTYCTNLVSTAYHVLYSTVVATSEFFWLSMCCCFATSPFVWDGFYS